MQKKLATLRAIIRVLLLAGLAACSKSTPAPSPVTSVSWLVDGSSVTVTPAKGYVKGATVEFVVSSTADGIVKAVSFSNLPNVIGSYDISNTATPGYSGPQGYCLYDTRTYAASAGTISITAIGPSSMSGSFEYTATHLFSSATKTVTNGRFTVGF